MKLFAAKSREKIIFYDDEKKIFGTTRLQNVRFKPGKTSIIRETEIEGFSVIEREKSPRYITRNLYLEHLYLKETGSSCEHINYYYLHDACLRMTDGCTLSDLQRELEGAPERYQKRREERKENELRREALKIPLGPDGKPLPYFITSMGIRFEKETENRTPGTFDFIRVPYSMSSTIPREELLSNIKKDFKVIVNHAVSRLENSGAFQRYGVPVEFLKETECILTKDRILQFTFELKIPA